MSHRDTDQPRVDRDLRDQLVRENGLTPDYINDAERQDREAAREWLNENVFDWMLPEHEIQLASEGSGGGGYWDGSMPVSGAEWVATAPTGPDAYPFVPARFLFPLPLHLSPYS